MESVEVDFSLTRVLGSVPFPGDGSSDYSGLMSLYGILGLPAPASCFFLTVRDGHSDSEPLLVVRGEAAGALFWGQYSTPMARRGLRQLQGLWAVLTQFQEPFYREIHGTLRVYVLLDRINRQNTGCPVK